MALLAIDTCLNALTLALRTDDERVVSISEDIGIGHAERIAPAFASLLDEAGIEARAITRIGATVGPGSFMGQRVGIAFAKGLKLGTGAETVALTTLEALAADVGGAVSVLIDARRGQVYAQSFSPLGEALDEARLLSYDDARKWIEREDRVAGSGVAAIGAPGEALGPLTPTPAALLRLTEERAPLPLRILYLRPPDAKLPSQGPL